MSDVDLCGLEPDHRELILQARLQLVVARDREIALRLDDEEARRHPDFEALLLRVEALFGELASELRGLDALTVLFEPKCRVAHLPHRDEFDVRSRACA